MLYTTMYLHCTSCYCLHHVCYCLRIQECTPSCLCQTQPWLARRLWSSTTLRCTGTPPRCIASIWNSLPLFMGVPRSVAKSLWLDRRYKRERGDGREEGRRLRDDTTTCNFCFSLSPLSPFLFPSFSPLLSSLPSPPPSQSINDKILSLDLQQVHAKIKQVDSHITLGNGIVIQVGGVSVWVCVWVCECVHVGVLSCILIRPQ